MKRYIVRLGAALAVVSATLAGTATAQTSEVLFSHKHWQVEIVAYDDGSYACLAEVSAPGESFSIWAFQNQSIRLQFYSTQWQFDGGTANLEVQIDRRGPWTMTNAELYENSVLFDLPEGDDTVRFVLEVAQGNTLILRNETGEQVQTYSLAGSRASIDALIECGEVLAQDGSPANPFN